MKQYVNSERYNLQTNSSCYETVYEYLEQF